MILCYLGWVLFTISVLDQQRRGFPSIQLRLLLHSRPFPLVNDGGHRLYRTMRAMCRKNGVRRARFRRGSDGGRR